MSEHRDENYVEQWVGWVQDEENNHDKVWGIRYLGSSNEYYRSHFLVFWGRRGKRLQKKVQQFSLHEATSLINKKAKGARNKPPYIRIPNDDLNSVYPEFERELNWLGFEANMEIS